MQSIGMRARPTWVRGPARIEGEKIVLEGGTAELYTIPDAEHGASLLFDLGNLRRLGEIVEVEGPDARWMDAIRLRDTGRALDFATSHGLLWHGPTRVGGGEVRESLKDWFLAGLDLSISMATYARIRRSQEEGSAEPVRSYLRMLRDAGMFERVALPDADNDLLDYASIQLAERITRGMSKCTPTLSAACGLLDDGEPVGAAGDFRFGNDPGELVGAANYQLARIVSRKELVRECEECGEMFVPDDPRQRYHRKCGNRKRQRESRQRRKAR